MLSSWSAGNYRAYKEHPLETHLYGALTPTMRAPLRGSAHGNEAVLRSFLENTLHEHTL